MLENNLKQLNFTPNEIKVYLALFEIGKSRAGKIIRTTNLHRNLVYTSLENLEKRNLVTKVIVKGVAEFSANHPSSLLDELDTKKQTAQQAILELEKKGHPCARDIQIFEGIDGIKQARNKVLNFPKGSEFFVLGANQPTQTPELEKFWRSFHKKREAAGIKQKMLYESTNDQRILNDIKWRNQLPGNETKFLPFAIDSPFWIAFGEDMANIGLAGDNPLIISLKSKEIVDGFKNYFDYFWNQKVHTSTGFTALQDAFYNMINELEPGEEYYVLGTMGHGLEEKIELFFDQYHIDRIKRKIKLKMLCYEESFIPISKRFKREDPENKLTQVKIYHESPPAPMQIVLYKQKAFITIHDGKNITVIHFDEPNAYAGFKNHFDKAWDQRSRTFKGKEGVQEAYSKLLNAAKPRDEVIIFAAKPGSPESARYNLKWNEEINKKTKGVRLLYYGNTTRNKERAQELRDVGCQAKTMPTEQELPISTIVMGNKTITTVWSNEPVAFFIEDKTTADAYRENFEQLWNQDTYILKGVDAVGDLFDEMLEHGEADLIGARGYFVDLRPEFTDDWEKRAIKSGFKMRNIVDPTVKGHRVTTFPFVKMKYTLNKEFSKLSVFWIYGNKVAISNWTEKEPIIVVIKNKHIYNLYKQQFELLWNN